LAARGVTLMAIDAAAGSRGSHDARASKSHFRSADRKICIDLQNRTQPAQP